MFDLNDGVDDTDDTLDELAEFDTPDTPKLPRENAAEALASIALEAGLTRTSRALLKRNPSVIIITVPGADWTEIMVPAVRRLQPGSVVKTVTERLKQGGVLHRVGREDLNYLRHGRSVVYISPDPEELLHQAVLAAVDVSIAIAALTPALLRRLIRRVTGGVARGVTAAMVELDLPVIVSVVRPELTARQCVENLRRAVMRKPEPQRASVPLLSELPLTDRVSKWTGQALRDLEVVKAGTMPPDQLVFAMLEGVPGTGKTLIAESLARTAGWAFVPSSVGAWFTTGDGALGGVARNLKSFIDQVLASEPAIGFMDELDALPDRATMDNRGRDWWTPVINLFLTEIDRLRRSGRKVLLLGATNYYDRLDSALIRPGRLQQRVCVLPPQTEAEVSALIRYYLKDDLADTGLANLARIGRGATPALVEGWVKQARSAARSDNRPLEVGDILAQMVPEDDRSAADIRTIALHEIGHAVVAYRLGQGVESVSIIPDDGSGGRTLTSLTSIVPTWQRLLDMVTVALAGRAADIVLGDGPNSGAEGDLANATTVLLAAYQRQGLGESLVFAPALASRPSCATASAVAADLQRLLQRAMAMVEADRAFALLLADRLIAEKVLSGRDIAEGLGPNPVSPRAPVRSRWRQTGAEPSISAAGDILGGGQ